MMDFGEFVVLCAARDAVEAYSSPIIRWHYKQAYKQKKTLFVRQEWRDMLAKEIRRVRATREADLVECGP